MLSRIWVFHPFYPKTMMIYKMNHSEKSFKCVLWLFSTNLINFFWPITYFPIQCLNIQCTKIKLTFLRCPPVLEMTQHTTFMFLKKLKDESLTIRAELKGFCKLKGCSQIKNAANEKSILEQNSAQTILIIIRQFIYFKFPKLSSFGICGTVGK